MPSTPEQAESPRLAAWLAEALVEPLCKALDRAGITLVAAAGNGQHIASLGEKRAIEVCSDPKELLRDDVDAVLVADPALGLETEVVATMMQQAARIGACLRAASILVAAASQPL